jgi:hypothetical protein
MKHSLDELLDIAHRHYPRGIPSDDPRYKETEEYRRLVAARRRAGADNERWRGLLRRLDDHCPGRTAIDCALHLPGGEYDASYSAYLPLPTNAPGERDHSLGFLVSILVPYYVVYSSRTVDEVRPRWPARLVFDGDTCIALPTRAEAVETKQERQGQRHELGLDPSPDEQPYAAWIARDIEATFGYERMPPEVGKVLVPDVSTVRRDLGGVTLYDCLFSDAW